MNKKIDLEELTKGKKFEAYKDEAEYIFRLISSGHISPVRASGTNGKSPALYNRYWLNEKEDDDPGISDEINFRLSPLICTDYYKKHTDVYRRERSFVLSLSRYLDSNRDTKPSEVISVNERSFEIWGREKFLSGQKADGITAADILKHCGITVDQLQVYPTAEPFAYYTHFRSVPQNILILENLDPFYGLRKYLIEEDDEIFGLSFGTMIYGGGKRIVKSFRDFELSAEPYLMDRKNKFYYAGDLDYEGIGIYESLAEKIRGSLEIRPFIAYYDRMLKKAYAKGMNLPLMKDGQREIPGDRFFDFFPVDKADKIRGLLSDGYYIPQEILNKTDYAV